MIVYSRMSVQVSAQQIAPRIVECSYGGIITANTMPEAFGASLKATSGASAGVARTDLAVFTLRDLPPIPKVVHGSSTLPAALVCLPSMHEFWQEWARLMAREAGVVRAVFLAKNLELARRWAEDRAAEVREEFPPSLRFPQWPGRADRSTCRTILRSQELRA